MPVQKSVVLVVDVVVVVVVIVVVVVVVVRVVVVVVVFVVLVVVIIVVVVVSEIKIKKSAPRAITTSRQEIPITIPSTNRFSFFIFKYSITYI